jgi:ribosomal protein L11 methyltransferase
VNLIQLEIDTDATAAEPIEERLFALGAQSVVWLDAEDSDLIEPEPGALPVWAQVTIRAFFIDSERAALAAAALSREGKDGTNARLASVEAQDWVRAGLDGLEPLHVGGSLWIVPTWLESPAPPGSLALRLDPGLAFGTGNHPTTAMCLRALAEQPPEGRDVLDCGTGSGILAIAALMLGAHSALATDVDPLALKAVCSNAGLNRIDPARLQIADASQAIPADRFDLVLANILAGPLIALAADLAGALRPRGRILLSGLLEAQVDSVVEAYQSRLHMRVRSTEAGWVLLEGTRI